MIESNVRWTIFLVCCCVRPTSSEIVRTMSFLVTHDSRCTMKTSHRGRDDRCKPLQAINLNAEA